MSFSWRGRSDETGTRIQGTGDTAMRLPNGSVGLLAAAAVLAGAPGVEAHRPPPGHALEYRGERAGHIVEVMVVPKAPRAGERAEVIVAIRDESGGAPYRGYLTFLG